MTFLSKLMLPFAFTFLFSQAQAGLLSISEKEINHYLATKLAEKVALNDTVGIPHFFQLTYRLHHLQTQIGQTEEKRVALFGIVDGELKVKNRVYPVQLSLNLDTVPYYYAEKGEIYLKEVRLNQWAISPEKYQQELQPFVAPLASGLASLLDRTPVYTLDESKTKEALFKRFGKNIVVKKGEIELETGIF